MKRFVLLVFALLIACSFTFAQDAKPAAPVAAAVDKPKEAPAEVELGEVETLKVQTQLLLQENATLRKQLAETQRNLSDANMQLAGANEKNVSDGGTQLIQQLAAKSGVTLETHDLKFVPDPKTGVVAMKFVKKAPAKQ